MVKFKISEQYYRRSRPKQSLAQFEAWRTPQGNVEGVIRKDPILRGHPKLEKEIVKHESRELKLTYTKFSDRSDPKRMEKGHRVAQSKEPAWLRKEVRKLRTEAAKTNPRWL
jgi:hypothetical protein